QHRQYNWRKSTHPIRVDGGSLLTQYNCCQHRCHIRTKEVSTHTSHVTHIITYIIGNGGGVAGIILGNTCFYFTNEVSTHVCSFCLYTTAHTGKKGNGFSTQGKTCQHFDRADHFI